MYRMFCVILLSKIYPISVAEMKLTVITLILKINDESILKELLACLEKFSSKETEL